LVRSAEALGKRPVSARGHDPGWMEDQRFGAAIRATRVRRRMTQRQLAHAAGASDGSVSRLERGLCSSMALATIRAIAKVLDVRVELLPRSRAADLERVVAGAHAALADAVVAWIASREGWIVRPEVGFSNWGERGVIDLLAWHAGRRTLLVIELKTELVDINALLGTLDRYVRNAPAAVVPFGWQPLVVARLLIVGESDFNRRRVREHGSLLAAALPDRVATVRRWLGDPTAELAGLMFFANRHPGSTNAKLVTVRRVRGRNRPPNPVAPSTAEHGSGSATARRPR
jgi:transcriptional regulator with XRE-family HTH domain